ncbi:MAG: twin-arginine translocation signal domain-containing protein [Chloroflexota bacterium]
MALKLNQSTLSRRQFLAYSTMGGGAMIVAACGINMPEEASAPTEAPAEEPTMAPAEEPAAEPAMEMMEAPPTAADPEGGKVMAGDVIDYTLDSNGWSGMFGSVTFFMHHALYDGEDVYLIRTDASNEEFANEVGLTFVPLLSVAAAMPEEDVNTYYMFSDGRPPVVSMIPGDEKWSSLCRVVNVDPGDSDVDLSSSAGVMEAADAGDVTMEATDVFVNYPFIKWPGGELAVDTELTQTLGPGQLFAAPDTENMTVTMKLHQCYPGSRYIVTDAGMMGGMMAVSDAPVTNQLKALGGTDEIWVFGNGIEGSGVMGFQPAIFDHKAGDPAWSPFWDHFTLTWNEPGKARILTDASEIRAMVESGDLEQFNGVPDSHPNGFVVNCPAPILAPNDFAVVMANDVVDYTLDSDEWAGAFGSVTMMMHEAMYNGESVYHVRTDASDQSFADEVGLTYVPLLNVAAGMDASEVNTYYMLDGDRNPVIAMIPGDENYSSLFRMVNVSGGDESLTSAEAVQAAIDAGDATMEETGVYVNYPLIAWPGGGLSVDPDLEATLGPGQLFADPDMGNMTVTMKLHQCYPGSRYIVTDAGMMGGMMNVSDAPITNKLKELGGTDEIWVFGNGIEGPGVMGFQPAIFDNHAGDPAWSPFWDHFTLTWSDEASATILTSSNEIRSLVDSGDLEQFNGVPDSHPTGFVVNCPAPILAPNPFHLENM